MNKNVEFPVLDTYNLDALKKTQDRLLVMAKTAIDILERNGFKYFICFGTLLGAVRHEGFIPWDDDFDMYLFDDEYDAAIECLRKELPNDIFVEDGKSDPLYYASWSVLKDRKSVRYKNGKYDGSCKETSGINLDLYKLEKVKRKDITTFLKRQNVEYICRRHETGRISTDEYLMKLNTWCKDYVNALENIDDNMPGANDDVFVSVMLVYEHEIDEILPLKKYKFEDVEFWGPNNFDAHLQQWYTDKYMEFPPYAERRPHCDEIKFID